jgi:hypothetical protein
MTENIQLAYCMTIAGMQYPPRFIALLAHKIPLSALNAYVNVHGQPPNEFAPLGLRRAG